jgi:hypothetical protein
VLLAKLQKKLDIRIGSLLHKAFSEDAERHNNSINKHANILIRRHLGYRSKPSKSGFYYCSESDPQQDDISSFEKRFNCFVAQLTRRQKAAIVKLMSNHKGNNK